MSVVRLHIRDCRDCGYCVVGVKRRFHELGLDFHRLLREGIPVDELAGVEDAQLQRAIARAEDRANGKG